MKLTKLLSVAGITGGVILAAAAPAFAHNDNHPDPCPGQHVSIYDSSNQAVEGQFICGPMQGLAGPAGPQGPKGDTGATGPAGINGVGLPGPQGLPGTPGVAGAPGPQGNPGYSVCPDGTFLGLGVKDCTGHLAPAGPAGPQGPAGPAGAVVAAATQTATTTTTAPAAALPGGDLPHTGTNTTLPLTLLGVGLLILGAGTLSLRRHTSR